MKIIKQIMVFYLVFFIIGCGVNKPPVSASAAREMESRIIYGKSKDILKASMNVLQDMYYTIEEVDSDMGILIASKLSEGKQAEIRKEKSVNDDMSLGKKIFYVIFVVVIIGGVLYLISGDSKKSDENNRKSYHHHHHNNRNSKTIHRYKVTINASQNNFDETKLRITAQGEKIANDEIINAGPIHDTQFYDNFFNMLENELENQY